MVTLLLPGCQARLPVSTVPLFKIGLVAPFEGRFRARGYEVLYGVRLAVRQWNATAGQGYRIELVALDDGADPAAAVGQVRELAIDPDVLGVIGHFDEGATLAAAAEYAAQRLALIAPGVGGEGLTAAGWVLRLGASNRLLGREAARYAVDELGAARLAVLRGQADLADAFVAAARSLGAEITLDTAIDASADTWVDRLCQAQPDLIFFSGDVLQGSQALLLVRQAGVDAPFLGGPALGDRALVQMGGSATEGVVFLAAAPGGADLPAAQAFVSAYREMAGHLPGPQATLAYEAAHLLLRAIADAARASGSRPSREAVWQQLSSGWQHEELLGALAWDASGEPLDWPVVIYQIEAGVYPGRRLR
ncbi:MAG: branched-chain amino acid ABC transporter substrate-binding protein [Chloroflexota bacterium]